MPAWMITTFGFSAITSWRKRTSICGCRLSRDAAIQVRLAGKELALLPCAPVLRDLVAQEDDAILARFAAASSGVLAAVARQAAPIHQQSRLRSDFLFQFFARWARCG